MRGITPFKHLSLRDCLGLDPIDRLYYTHTVAVINGQTASTDADLSNLAVAFITGGGVVGSSDYLVQAQGSPNMTVLVNTGRAYVPNSAATMVYSTILDGTLNVTVPANATGSTQIDAIVLYINLSASVNAGGTNVATLADVRGTGGVAPTNAQILAAIGASNPYITLATVSVVNGATSITSGNITDQRTFSKLSGGDTTFQSAFANFVSSGFGTPTSGSLATTIAKGVIYFNGINVSVASDGGHTYTASKDTYVDVSNTGVYTYNAVSNGAAAPALTANSIRIAKVVTSGSAVTSVTQSGFDSLGNKIYPTNPTPLYNNMWFLDDTSASSQQTTTNTSYEDMATLSQVVPLLVKSNVSIFGKTNAINSSANGTDGHYVYLQTAYNDGSDHALGLETYNQSTNAAGTPMTKFGMVTLSPGTYTFKLQKKIATSGTGTYYNTSMLVKAEAVF